MSSGLYGNTVSLYLLLIHLCAQSCGVGRIPCMTLLIQRSILQIHCVPVQFHFLLLSERQSIASNAQLYSLEALITINRTDLFNVLYYRHVHGLTCLHVYTSIECHIDCITYLFTSLQYSPFRGTLYIRRLLYRYLVQVNDGYGNRCA